MTEAQTELREAQRQLVDITRALLPLEAAQDRARVELSEARTDLEDALWLREKRRVDEAAERTKALRDEAAHLELGYAMRQSAYLGESERKMSYREYMYVHARWRVMNV